MIMQTEIQKKKTVHCLTGKLLNVKPKTKDSLQKRAGDVSLASSPYRSPIASPTLQ